VLFNFGVMYQQVFFCYRNVLEGLNFDSLFADCPLCYKTR